MTATIPDPKPRRRAIGLWLVSVAALIFAMVVVGGATRLTQSGLSIVEWNPVIGVLPPLSQESWNAEFTKYQSIPQYQQINRGMSLDQFKVIYWWEWAHRQLGRFIGAAFLLPLLWFLWKGWMEIGFLGRMWLIFAVGAVQGFVGWWMVASGLADRVEVSQYRLAIHLTLACALFAAILWTAQRLLHAHAPPIAGASRVGAMGAGSVCPARSAARPQRLQLSRDLEPRCAADAGPPQARPWRSRISGAPLARARAREWISPVFLGARSRCTASGTRT